jgi:hypothetical protein
VFVTVKNVGFREDRVAYISPVAVELRDEAGRLVAPKAEYAEEETPITALFLAEDPSSENRTCLLVIVSANDIIAWLKASMS